MCGRSRAVGNADVNSGCAAFPEYQTHSRSTAAPSTATRAQGRRGQRAPRHPGGADPNKHRPKELTNLTNDEESAETENDSLDFTAMLFC